MIIIATRLHHYRLPLRSEWATAAGDFAWREGWLVQLETDDGRYGHGDCAPLPASGTEKPGRAVAALRAYAEQLDGRLPGDSLAALSDAADCNAPAARGAIESALLDLLAQAANLPLADYLRGSTGLRDVAANAALGSLLQGSEEAMLEAHAAGFNVVKLKVGKSSVAEEINHLQRIAEYCPAGLRLRLDANRAWDEKQAAAFLSACAGLPIEMFEEPLADPQPAALRRLQAQCDFPLALDESLANFGRQYSFVDSFDDFPVRRLVLKPPCHGGLLPTLALARRATTAGLECVVTSSVDSACGVLGAAHLAAALGNELAHGLATSSWLAEDTGTPPRIVNGRLALPGIAGLGFKPWPGLPFQPVAA